MSAHMTDPLLLGWLAVGGLLALLCTGKVIIPLAMWLTPVFLLHVARCTRAPGILLGIWLVLGAATAITNRGVLPIPGIGYIATSLMIPLAIPLAMLADRVLAPRLPGLASTLVFPLAWVTIELLRTRALPSATWGSPAYTQYGNLPLMQIVSVTGLSGIVFLLGWFASVVSYVWDHGWAPEAGRAVVLPYALVFGAVIACGALRMARARTDVQSIRVATISYPKELFVRGEVTRFLSDEMDPAELPAMREKVARLHAQYLEETRREARAGAALVVWPEENLITLEEDEAAFLDAAKSLARDERIYLLMGMGTVRHGAPHPLQNKAVLVTPSGQIEFAYHKSRLTPGWEASKGEAGTERLPVTDTPYGRLATAICFEMDFPQLIREVGVARADVLVAPSNDWLEIKQLHPAMAVFRAIENGVSLVRATSSGISVAVDPVGRVRSLSDDAAPNARIMVAHVPMRGMQTVYAKVGDLFGWLCVAGLLAAIGVAYLGPSP